MLVEQVVVEYSPKGGIVLAEGYFYIMFSCVPKARLAAFPPFQTVV